MLAQALAVIWVHHLMNTLAVEAHWLRAEAVDFLNAVTDIREAALAVGGLPALEHHAGYLTDDLL